MHFFYWTNAFTKRKRMENLFFPFFRRFTTKFDILEKKYEEKVKKRKIGSDLVRAIASSKFHHWVLVFLCILYICKNSQKLFLLWLIFAAGNTLKPERFRMFSPHNYNISNLRFSYQIISNFKSIHSLVSWVPKCLKVIQLSITSFQVRPIFPIQLMDLLSNQKKYFTLAKFLKHKRFYIGVRVRDLHEK